MIKHAKLRYATARTHWTGSMRVMEDVSFRFAMHTFKQGVI